MMNIMMMIWCVSGEAGASAYNDEDDNYGDSGDDCYDDDNDYYDEKVLIRRGWDLGRTPCIVIGFLLTVCGIS